MNRCRFSILFIWGLLWFTCCIDDNLDNCYPENPYALYFAYNGDGTTDIFPSKMENVRLFVFNTAGGYVAQYALSKTELDEFQGFQPDLPAGQYEIVCWANVTDLSSITGSESNLTSHYLFNRDFLAGSPIAGFDSLYYGRHTITIPESGGADTISFRSAHIKMEVFVEGLSTAAAINRAVNDPQGWLVVRNVSVGYNFRMQLTNDLASMYPVLTTADADINSLVARFNLFRFENENEILIDVYNGNGKLVYTLDLSKFIATNNLSVEGINEAKVSITIRFIDSNVHVSVTDWGSEIVDPII